MFFAASYKNLSILIILRQTASSYSICCMAHFYLMEISSKESHLPSPFGSTKPPSKHKIIVLISLGL